MVLFIFKKNLEYWRYEKFSKNWEKKIGPKMNISLSWVRVSSASKSKWSISLILIIFFWINDTSNDFFLFHRYFLIFLKLIKINKFWNLWVNQVEKIVIFSSICSRNSTIFRFFWKNVIYNIMLKKGTVHFEVVSADTSWWNLMIPSFGSELA